MSICWSVSVLLVYCCFTAVFSLRTHTGSLSHSLSLSLTHSLHAYLVEGGWPSSLVRLTAALLIFNYLLPSSLLKLCCFAFFFYCCFIAAVLLFLPPGWGCLAVVTYKLDKLTFYAPLLPWKDCVRQSGVRQSCVSLGPAEDFLIFFFHHYTHNTYGHTRIALRGLALQAERGWSSVRILRKYHRPSGPWTADKIRCTGSARNRRTFFF